jgi:3-phosphoshikimate 1-carboxyvinyltransferase
VKETDRIAAIAKNLRAMGVQVTEFDDGMEIIGASRLVGAEMTSHGDHRIAMAFAIAGLFAEGETIIRDVECVATSYPTFEQTLKLVRSGKAVPKKSATERGTLRASVARNRQRPEA